jgi:hypothetical protein
MRFIKTAHHRFVFQMAPIQNLSVIAGLQVAFVKMLLTLCKRTAVPRAKVRCKSIHHSGPSLTASVNVFADLYAHSDPQPDPDPNMLAPASGSQTGSWSSDGPSDSGSRSSSWDSVSGPRLVGGRWMLQGASQSESGSWQYGTEQAPLPWGTKGFHGEPIAATSQQRLSYL